MVLALGTCECSWIVTIYFYRVDTIYCCCTDLFHVANSVIMGSEGSAHCPAWFGVCTLLVSVRSDCGSSLIINFILVW